MLSFVATMDTGYSRYWSTVRSNASTEMGTKITSAMKEAINEFIKVNGNAPE
jgi:hypothetical protein